jgi:hypothetical protein
MRIEVLRWMTPEEVRAAVDGFSARYVADWEAWLTVTPKARPRLFGQTLRKWQATRLKAMRRPKAEAHHEPPFLDDLLESATESLSVLGDMTLLTVARRPVNRPKL